MSGAAHSPGPWIAVHCADDGGEFSIHAANGIHVALSIGGTKSEAANARLIAAAPELLEALEEAENALADYIPTIERTGASLNYGHSVLKKARAAIAKATEDQP